MIAPIGSTVTLTDKLRNQLQEIGYGKSLVLLDVWRAEITGSPKKNREGELLYPAKLIIPHGAADNPNLHLSDGETFPLRDSEFELESFTENKKMTPFKDLYYR